MNDILPRGIRNNNPGNIRLSSAKWQGQKKFQMDTGFVEFDEPVFGLRALMRLLLNYYYRHGLDTVESIINRYAPPHENATDGYINHVCRILHVGRRQKIALSEKDRLVGLTRAICRHENGFPPKQHPKDWYQDAVFEQAYELVLKG